MTDCYDAIRLIHDRMPVLLHPQAFEARRFPDDLIEINRTSQLWVSEEQQATMAARDNN